MRFRSATQQGGRDRAKMEMEKVHAAVEDANARASEAETLAFRAERRAEAAERELRELREAAQLDSDGRASEAEARAMRAEKRAEIMQEQLRTLREETSWGNPPDAVLDLSTAAAIKRVEAELEVARQAVYALEFELAELRQQEQTPAFEPGKRRAATGTVAAARVASVRGNRAMTRSCMTAPQLAKLDQRLLVAASLGDSVGCVEELLKGANPDFQDERGKTALHLAVAGSNLHSIKVLLASGATVDTACNDLTTPMSLAADLEMPDDIVRLLVAKGAKPLDGGR